MLSFGHMKSLLYTFLLTCGFFTLSAQPQEKDGGLFIQKIVYLDNVFQINNAGVLKPVSGTSTNIQPLIIQHFQLREEGNQHKKQLPLFNPSDFDYYGLYVPESFAYFISPSIGNNPSPDQRMIIIAGADSMVIDFHNIPKTTRYELTILQQIYFMPGYYSLDCSLPARDLKINENEREILYAAVKHGITPETKSILSKAGLLEMALPTDIVKYQKYIPAAITVEQSDAYNINVYFTGNLLTTSNGILITDFQESYRGHWHSTAFSTTFHYIGEESGTSAVFYENQKRVISQTNPMGERNLTDGWYRIGVVNSYGDSIYSKPFCVGLVAANSDSVTTLYNKQRGFPFHNFKDANTINIETAVAPVIIDHQPKYVFKYHIVVCNLCLFSDELYGRYDQLAAEEFMHRLAFNDLYINGQPFTGSIEIQFPIKGATVENGGAWFYTNLIVTNTYINGKLQKHSER